MGSCPRLCTKRVVKLTAIICACNEVTICAAMSLFVYTMRLHSYKGGHPFANNHSAATSFVYFYICKNGKQFAAAKITINCLLFL